LGEIKSFLLNQLGLSPSLVLVLVGVLSHAALCLLLRAPLASPWGLLAPLGIGLLIEAYEIWEHYKVLGLTAAGNDPVAVILLRHSLDVLKMLALPAALVVGGLLSQR